MFKFLVSMNEFKKNKFVGQKSFCLSDANKEYQVGNLKGDAR